MVYLAHSSFSMPDTGDQTPIEDSKRTFCPCAKSPKGKKSYLLIQDYAKLKVSPIGILGKNDNN